MSAIPRCHTCQAEGLSRLATEQPRAAARDLLLESAKELHGSGGCVHLAIRAGSLQQAWWATACGLQRDRLQFCARPEHVTCELCRRRAGMAQ